MADTSDYTYEDLLYPIRPLDNLANITSRDAGSPCRWCAALVPDRSKTRYNLIKTTYDRVDLYPDFPSLKETAKLGCVFCKLLRKTIRSHWAVRPMEGWGASPLRESDEYWSDLFGSPWDRKVKIHSATFLLSAQVSISEKVRAENDTAQGESMKDKPRGDIMTTLTVEFGPATLVPNTEGKMYGPIGQVLSFKIFDKPDLESATESTGRRLPSFISLSDENLARIRSWMQECQSSHSKCKRDAKSWAPTRLIDVNPTDGSREPRLVETAQERISSPYVALSHMWGDPSKKPPLETKLGTIEDRMSLSGIPMWKLPRNFQDALFVTRNLGYRYIWIDSLCIIQDSTEDWAREAAMMQQVYRHAAITVAATWAESSHDGFLQRSLGMTPCAKLNYKFDISNEGTQYFIATPISDDDTGTGFHDVDGSQWNTRGWTLQERSLSTCVLHFCKNKIYFECRMGLKSEEGEPLQRSALSSLMWPIDPDVVSDPNATPGAGAQNPAQESLYDRWMRTVAEYSKRRLTKDTDKLLALQGLVNNMASSADDKNVCGLWVRNLTQDLLWQVQDGIIVKSRGYPLPSWSWASFNAKIAWNRGPVTPRPNYPLLKTNHHFEILDIHVGGRPYLQRPESQSNEEKPKDFIRVRGLLQELVSVQECSDEERWVWGTRGQFPFDLNIKTYKGEVNETTSAEHLNSLSLGDNAQSQSYIQKLAEARLDLNDDDGLTRAKERHLFYLHVTDLSRPTGLLLEDTGDSRMEYSRVGVATLIDLPGTPFIHPNPILQRKPQELIVI